MQTQPLTIVKKTPLAAAPTTPVPLSIVKRDGKPVEPDFKVETVADMPGDGVPGFVRDAWDFVSGATEALGESVVGAIGGIGKALIPSSREGLPIGETLGMNDTGPAHFVKSAWDAQNKTLERAREAYAVGDLGNATMHFTNWLVPLIGPGVDEAVYGEKTPGENPSNAKRMGRATGVMASIFAPKAAANALGGRKIPALSKDNPDLPSEAMQFARDQGIPLDAATATGSKPVRNLKAVADNSITEGFTHRGQNFRKSQDAALERVGGELSDRARPADWTPERAAQHLRKQVDNRVGEGRAEAADAYKTLKDLEADPANATTVVDTPGVTKTTSDGRSAVIQPPVTRSVALATDLTPAKAGVKAWYDELLARQARVGLDAPETKVLRALDRLIEAPDTVALSAADGILGGFKSIARGAPATGRAQAAAVKAITELSTQVDASARTVPGATKALAEGRAATRAKYQALEMLDELNAEPVRAFRDLMSAGDASLVKLRALAKFTTPADMATLGRAWLQQGVEGVAGGKQGWTKMKSDWNKVGAETRKIVFGKDTTLPRDIDHFLRVASEIEKNPNPSGSALNLITATQGAALLQFAELASGAKILIGADLLSRLMYSPTGVRLLTRGLVTPKGNKAATAAIGAELATMSQRLGGELAPAAAEGDGEKGRRRP